MAEQVQRFCWYNLVTLSSSTLSASSTLAGSSVSWIRDASRRKTWRSKIGWDITAGVNDKADYLEDSLVRSGTVAPGTYATGTALAAALQTAVNAALPISDPTAVSGLTAWYRADTLTTIADGTAIPAWPEDGSYIQWVNKVGVVQGTNRKLTKVYTGGQWDSGAFGPNSIASGDGFLELVVDSTGTFNRMVGLSNTDADQNYTSIKYAFYLSTAQLEVRENGTQRATSTMAVGDILRIEVSGGSVKYYKNGALLYTSLLSLTYPLYPDCALSTSGCILPPVIFGTGSANTKDLAQATGGNQPKFYSAVIGSLPAIRFDGTDDYLDSAVTGFWSAFSLGAGTGFVVAIANSAGAGSDCVIGNQGGTQYIRLEYDHAGLQYQQILNTSGGTKTVSKAATRDAVHVVSFVYDSTNQKAGVDDTKDSALASSAAGAAITDGNLRIGRAAAGSYFQGDIAEVITYNRALTQAERLGVEAYLHNKYGLSQPNLSTYTVTFSTSTNKFTMAKSAGLVSVLGIWPGPSSPSLDWPYSVWPDAGFNDGSHTSGTSRTGDVGVYQSRKWIAVDLGAVASVSCGLATGHNLTSTGSMIMQGDIIPLTYGAAYASHLIYQSMPDPTYPVQAAFFSPSSSRYLRLVIKDVQNQDGFSELGVWFAGPYFQPSRSMAQGYQNKKNDLSEVVQGDTGVLYQNRRTSKEAFSFTTKRISRASMLEWRGMLEDIGIGGCFFLALDPDNYPYQSTFYGALVDSGTSTHGVGDGTPPERFTITFSFQEA